MNEVLQLLYAGSLDRLLAEDLLPQFEAVTGYPSQGRAGGSREWARALRGGEAQADVFLSADAQVNEIELMGEANGRLVEWYLTFAANEMVIAHTRNEPALRLIAAALAGISSRSPFVKLLRSGLRLCRTDPETDPKGYRAIQAIELLSRHLQVPDLVRDVLGEPRNPEQLIAPAEMMGAIARGDYDLGLTYRSQAVESGLPFIVLPDPVDLGSPACADAYAQVAYRCADGAVYPGAPITYTAAMLTTARRPLAAAAFLTFLASGQAAPLYEKHGFRPIASSVRGRG